MKLSLTVAIALLLINFFSSSYSGKQIRMILCKHTVYNLLVRSECLITLTASQGTKTLRKINVGSQQMLPLVI